jgi:hypothetical protein
VGAQTGHLAISANQFLTGSLDRGIVFEVLEDQGSIYDGLRLMGGRGHKIGGLGWGHVVKCGENFLFQYVNLLSLGTISVTETLLYIYITGVAR